mgnify:CR=1 FL=1
MKSRSLIAPVLAPLSLFVSHSPAANITWANAGKTFSSGLNWVGGVAPADDLITDNAVFGGTPSSGFQPNITANRSISKLSFGSAGWEFTANAGVTLSLGTGGVLSTTASAGTSNTISAPLALAALRTFEVAGSSTHSLNLEGIVSGAGGINKTGIGILVLNANNTYAGATTVTAGTIRLGNNNRVDVDSDLSVASGATFDVNGFSDNAASISGAGSITLGAGGSFSFGWDDTSTVWSGVVSGNTAATFLKYGSGTWTLSGLVDFGTSAGGGTITVGEGTLQLGASNRISNGTAVHVLSAGTLSLQGYTDFIAQLSGSGLVNLGNGTLNASNAANVTWTGTISGPGTFQKGGNGIFTIGSGGSIEGSVGNVGIQGGTLVANTSTLSSNVAISPGATLQMDQDLSSPGFSSAISGGGLLVKNGAGTLTLSGANSGFTGDVIVNAGNLSLSGADALSQSTDVTLASGTSLLLNSTTRTLRSVSGDGGVSLGSAVLTISPSNDSLVLNGVISGSGGLSFSPVNSAGSLTLGGNNSYSGTTNITNGTLFLGASNRISAASDVVIQSGATFHLNGFSDSVGAISGSGSIQLGGGSLSSSGSVDSTFSGVISGTGNFTKSNIGTLTLSGSNTYAGTTTIFSGTLRLGAANRLPNGTTVDVQPLGAWDLNNFSETIHGLVGYDGAVVSLGSGSLSLGGGSGTYNTSFDGIIQGTGGLNVQGINGGTLTLGGANTYTGDTFVNGGAFAQSNLRIAANQRIADASPLKLGLSGNFHLQGFSETVANLEGGGDVDLGNGGSLEFGENDVSTTFSGLLSGSTNIQNSSRIEKCGSGTLTMTGTASGHFDTELYWNRSGDTGMGYGGHIILNSSENNALSDTGRLTIVSPPIANQTSTVTLALGKHETVGPLTVGQYGEIIVTSGYFTSQSSENSLVTGVISGGGSFIKSGSGTLEFTLDFSGYGLRTNGMDTVAEGIMKGTLNNMPGDMVVMTNAELQFRQNYDGSLEGRELRNGGMIRLDTGVPGTTYSVGAVWTNFFGIIQLSGGAHADNHISSGTGYTSLQLANSTLSLGLDQAGNGPEVFHLDHVSSMDLGKIMGNGVMSISHTTGSLRTGLTNENFTFHGRLTGLGSLSKRGTGTMTLTNSSSDLAGFYNIESGGTLRSGNNEVINGAGLSVTGIFDLDGYTETLTSLIAVGEITLGGGSLRVMEGESSSMVSESGSFSKISGGDFLFTGQFLQTGGLNAFDGTLTLDGATASGQSHFVGAGNNTLVKLQNAASVSAVDAEFVDEVQMEISGKSQAHFNGLRLYGSETLVEKGGLLDIAAGTIIVSDENILRIRNSTVNLGALTYTGGTLVIDMQGGSLSWGGNLTVDSDGWFGQNMVVSEGEKIVLTGNTHISELGSLTLDGGIFSTGSMSRVGALVLNRGTIEFTNQAGVSLGNGPLANGIQIPYGVEMRVTKGPMTVTGSGTTLYLTGGTLKADTLQNAGILVLDAGVFEINRPNDFQINASNSGTILLGNTAAITGVLVNSGRITLRDDSGFLHVSNVLENSGLIHGAGRVKAAGGIQNQPSGEIRGEIGKHVTLESEVLNMGKISLQGGSLEFLDGLQNGLASPFGSPVISGRGTLISSGITNRASMSFSSGNTDIYGDVTNLSGGRIVTSGGAAAVTTFFDDVLHNGTEIRTSAGSSTVFFGSLSGSGPFTGPGTVYVEGDMRPGNSPGVMSFGGDLVLSSTSHLVFEIGGELRGSGYDAALISGQFLMGGTLEIIGIPGFVFTSGMEFDLFDWGVKASDFDEIQLPVLTEGLEWDMSEFETQGVVSVVSTAMTYDRWKITHAFSGQDDASSDPDRDGRSNLIEYIFGTNPLLAEVSVPSLPEMRVVEVLGVNYLALRYRRPSEASQRRSDVTESVTRSTTLAGTWSANQVVLHSAIDDGNQETLTYRSTVPLGSISAEFLRFEGELSH